MAEEKFFVLTISYTQKCDVNNNSFPKSCEPIVCFGPGLWPYMLLCSSQQGMCAGVFYMLLWSATGTRWDVDRGRSAEPGTLHQTKWTTGPGRTS